MDFFRPHRVDPDKKKIRIAFAYKNFAAHHGISHIGLGVSLDNTRRTLEDHYAAAEGLEALTDYVAAGIHDWFQFLNVPCEC